MASLLAFFDGAHEFTSRGDLDDGGAGDGDDTLGVFLDLQFRDLELK